MLKSRHFKQLCAQFGFTSVSASSKCLTASYGSAAAAHGTLPQNMTPCEHVSPHTGKILTSQRWRFRSCLGRSMRYDERQNKARSWCKRSAGTSKSLTMPKSILHTPLLPSDGLQCLSMLLVSCKSCVEPSKYYVCQTVVLECRSKMFLHAMQILTHGRVAMQVLASMRCDLRCMPCRHI